MFLLLLFLKSGIVLCNSGVLYIDNNDRLSEDLMPTRLLVLPNIEFDSDTNADKNQSDPLMGAQNHRIGSLSEAMKTMSFHR